MKIFFDTNLLIYLWEEDKSSRARRVRQILQALGKDDGILATSTLSYALEVRSTS